MPDFNTSDIVLLLPAVIANIYFWPRWFKKYQMLVAPTHVMGQNNQLRDALTLVVWMFAVILGFMAIYLPLTFIIYRYFPPPLLFG